MTSVAAARLRRRWLWPALVVIAALLIIADREGWLLVPRSDDLAAFHGRSAAVVAVIDGDTIDVALPDTLAGSPVTRVRLWGIDCRELARFGEPDEPLAREAQDLAARLLSNQRVMLHLDAHQTRDMFGRLLAHVEITGEMEGGRSLNEALLEAGLARADDRWPHARLTRYAQVELVAKRDGKGIWAKALPAVSLPD